MPKRKLKGMLITGFCCSDGIPKVIISNRDPKFTSNLWRYLFKGLNTMLNFSTSFYPQIDGQTERVNQVLEDLLRMYVKEQLGKWWRSKWGIQFLQFADVPTEVVSIVISDFILIEKIFSCPTMYV